MMNKKVDLIRNLCEKHEITSYEIGKNTHLNEKTVRNILNGTTKKPSLKNQNIILDYIQERIVGTQINEDTPAAAEPTAEYTTNHDQLLESIKANTDKVPELEAIMYKMMLQLSEIEAQLKKKKV